MPRLPQLLLIVFPLATCWLAMQVVHEFGHVLGVWSTGGTVAKVVLRPWTFSRTDFIRNPSPLLVTWAGPVLGAVLPLAVWLVAKALHCPGDYLLRFFAGFCLVANGAYIGGGAVFHEGDAGVLELHGSPMAPLFLFAATTVPLGLWLWHRQGRHFGFAGAGGKIDRWALVACAMALIVVLALEFVLGSE